jgi:recombinational DNA repair protein (RecF pathway)
MDHYRCVDCKETYPKDQVVVYDTGIHCLSCSKETEFSPVMFTVYMTWSEISSLEKYLDGEVDVEILENIDHVKEAVTLSIRHTLRRVLGRE